MRIAKWFIVSVALLLIIIYYTGGYIALELLKFGVEYARPELTRHGIDIKQFEYGKVNLHSFRSFLVRDVDMKFDLEQEIYGKKSFNAEFYSESIIIRIINFNDPTIRLSLNNFDLYIQTNEDRLDRPFGKFENAYWKGEAPIRLYDIKNSGEILIDRLKTLFRDNSIPDIMEFKGDAFLNLDGKDIKVRVFTERIDGRTYLKLDKEDILNASKDFDDVDISEEEAELLSQYPARVLHIIKISRDAKRISEKEAETNLKFPEDALKHIYWSYHLARTFGPEFAKKITDAHETLPNNTRQQRIMDYNNNNIGFHLANEDLTLKELKDIVLNNPEVIKFPEEVKF